MRHSLVLPAAVLALGSLTGPSAAQAYGPPPAPEVRWDPRPGEALPDVILRDESGEPLSLREAVGSEPTILAFVYFECPMLCSLVLDGLVRSMKAIPLNGGAEYRVLALDIDPGETPALAARARETFLERYDREGAEPAGIRFLTGDEASVRAAADAVGFQYTYVPETDEYAHAAGITVVTPEARVSHYFYGVEYSPRDLRLALVEASEGRIGTTFDHVLLRCFRYDPARGAYGLAILTAIRIGGVTTVLALALFVLRALLRDRRLHRVEPLTEGGR